MSVRRMSEGYLHVRAIGGAARGGDDHRHLIACRERIRAVHVVLVLLEHSLKWRCSCVTFAPYLDARRECARCGLITHRGNGAGCPRKSAISTVVPFARVMLVGTEKTAVEITVLALPSRLHGPMLRRISGRARGRVCGERHGGCGASRPRIAVEGLTARVASVKPLPALISKAIGDAR